MKPAFHPEAALAYEEGLDIRGSQHIQKATKSWRGPGRLLGERGAGAEQELARPGAGDGLPLSMAFEALSLERLSS